MYYYLQVKTVILLYVISHIQGFFHLTHEDFLLENETYINPVFRDEYENWIEQPVDHFNASDRRTWKQKYYKVINAWKPKGAILLHLNGANPMPLAKHTNIFSKDNGREPPLVAQIAYETGAVHIMLEHRYYWNSQPFYPHTIENMVYFTSRQALADAARLLTTMKESPKYKNSKVIVVGSSYGGNLAAWMKLLYPQMIDAVLASSAPVLAKVDYSEFFETVTDTFRKYGSQDCVNKVTEIFDNFRELLQSSEGIEKLKKDNNICSYVDMTDPESQQLFFSDKIRRIAMEAQYGTPHRINSVCRDIKGFITEKRFSNYWNDDNDCRNYDLNNWISCMYDGLRCWIYQMCTEFGYFQTSSSSKQMFGKSISIEFYYNHCKTLFGPEFNEERVKQGVMNTNRLYGGLTPNVTNVVFVNGDMDPWHRLSIVQDLSADAPAIYIEGSSNSHDLEPVETDADNIRKARKRIIDLMVKWTGQK